VYFEVYSCKFIQFISIKKDASFNEKLFSSLNDTSFFQWLYQT